jgi:uncharacterized membrane protein
MHWSRLTWFRSSLRFSLWAASIISIPCALAATQLSHWLDDRLGWPFLGFAMPGAQVLLQATVTACLSFVVFTFGSLLVAIQVASGQMTPRIIATVLLRNNVIRGTVGLFMFTLIFAIGAQNRLDGQVNQLPLFIAGMLCVISFAVFLFLIDYASRLLRPISILTHVADNGLAVIESVYPLPTVDPSVANASKRQSAPPDRTIFHSGTSGIILAVAVDRLLAESIRLRGLIEFAPQVGDFAAVSEPLFYLYGGAVKVDDSTLRDAVALGSERTMEQDPTFSFRIVVDIALKALSPAINDPTTAVLALDQLHRMLRSVGMRHLRTDEILDDQGDLRVIFRTPNWEDFVHLALTEIRLCGASSVQIARRIRAMIENLTQALPVHRHAALIAQLRLLDRDIERLYANREDLDLARQADSQGLGGSSGIHGPSAPRAAEIIDLPPAVSGNSR